MLMTSADHADWDKILCPLFILPRKRILGNAFFTS